MVEQNQILNSNFPATTIHNTMNLIHINSTIHRYISSFYSSAQSKSNGMVFRQYMSSLSYIEQYEYAKYVLRLFGVDI